MLNPVTAYPFLILSDDRKQVKRGEKLQFYRNSQQRFDVWSCVVAKEGFSTGRHYWEVRHTASNDHFKTCSFTKGQFLVSSCISTTVNTFVLLDENSVEHVETKI